MSESHEQASYHELLCYTLTHSDPAFIHQHVVDAYAAQHADERGTPISVVFPLLGLYLYVEQNVSGKRIQQIHMQIGKLRHVNWPALEMPEHRGDVTVSDVVSAPPGPRRDEMIRVWCESVWRAWRDSHAGIRAFVAAHLK